MFGSATLRIMPLSYFDCLLGCAKEGKSTIGVWTILSVRGREVEIVSRQLWRVSKTYGAYPKLQTKTPPEGGVFITWWPGAESNHRHKDFQSYLLPKLYPTISTKTTTYKKSFSYSGALHRYAVDSWLTVTKMDFYHLINIFKAKRGNEHANPFFHQNLTFV